MPGRDLTLDRAAMRRVASKMRCAHASAVPVDALDGERVAWLCPSCDAQLPADWKPPQAAWQPRYDYRRELPGCPRCHEMKMFTYREATRA